MNKFSKKDFSTWKTYEGFAEGSGRSEKQWLQSADGKKGLFKWPKADPTTGIATYEHVAEHLAHQLGNVVDIATAEVDIGEYDNRIGSMSYLVNKDNEELREGAWFLLGKYPDYDLNNLQDKATGKYYSVEQVLGLINQESFRCFLIDMMLFDYLIGNRDRHQNNWACLLSVENKNSTLSPMRPCPLYDNGSSLCCYIMDSQIEQYFGRDSLKVNSLVDTKSRSIIRVNPYEKKQPRHSEVVRYLARKYPYTKQKAEEILEKLTNELITDILNQYPEDLLSERRKALLSLFLSKKIELLGEILDEVYDEK